LRFVLFRVLQSLVALTLLSVVVFVLARTTGDPLHLILPMSATEEDYANARRYLGLDRPYVEQYLSFVGKAVTCDLGTSIRARRRHRGLRELRAAWIHAGLVRGGRHHAPAALGNARGPRLGVREARPAQGRGGAPGGVGPRAEERAHPRRHVRGHLLRDPGHDGDRRRDGVRVARARAAGLRRHHLA